MVRIIALASILVAVTSTATILADSPTAGIQEEIDALGGKGVVTLKPRRYVIRASILVPSEVTIRGASKATIVKCPGVATRLSSLAKSGVRKIKVADATGFLPEMQITLARKNKGYSSGDMDAWSFDWTHPRITRVEGNTINLDRPLDERFPANSTHVVNFFPAFYVERAEKVTLEGLIIQAKPTEQPEPFSEYQTAAISLLLSKQVNIRDCKVSGWPSDGISIQGGADVTVERCEVQGVRGHGFHPGSRATRIRFTENVGIENKWDGLYFCMAVTKSIVEKNRFLKNGRHGIGGLGGGKKAETRDKDNIVRQNLCEGNMQAGIEIDVSHGHQVTQNICRGNSQAKPGAWPGILVRRAEQTHVINNSCPTNETQREAVRTIELGEDTVVENNNSDVLLD